MSLWGHGSGAWARPGHILLTSAARINLLELDPELEDRSYIIIARKTANVSSKFLTNYFTCVQAYSSTALIWNLGANYCLKWFEEAFLVFFVNALALIFDYDGE